MGLWNVISRCSLDVVTLTNSKKKCGRKGRRETLPLRGHCRGGSKTYLFCRILKDSRGHRLAKSQTEYLRKEVPVTWTTTPILNLTEPEGLVPQNDISRCARRQDINTLGLDVPTIAILRNRPFRCVIAPLVVWYGYKIRPLAGRLTPTLGPWCVMAAGTIPTTRTIRAANSTAW